MSDLFERLARVELLDGWPDLDLDRWRVYDEITPLQHRDGEGWSVATDAQIRRVFQVASQEATGIPASVADQRLAQFEILEHADVYAALASLPTADIRDEQEWWAPNWAWFLTLRELQEAGEIHDPAGAEFFSVAPILLTAAADRLASFYSVVASHGTDLLRQGVRGRLGSDDRATVTLLVEVLRERSGRFLSGPDAYGRYLEKSEADESEVEAALAELAAAWRAERPLPRGVRSIAQRIRQGVRPMSAEDRVTR